MDAENLLPVNQMLHEEITKLNCAFIPPNFNGNICGQRLVADHLGKLVDSLGRQSALAQGLSKPITTTEKFRNTTTSYLYLLKDAAGNYGNGRLIGLLKVGHKHLFVFDTNNKCFEVEPMCVLDFFVNKHYQRRGYGTKLFNFMLDDLKVTPLDLAYDGPSPKLEQFLAKNYEITGLKRQNNNFAVPLQFFDRVEHNRRPRDESPANVPAVGRFTAHRPPSTIGMIIHGGNGSQATDDFPRLGRRRYFQESAGDSLSKTPL